MSAHDPLPPALRRPHPSRLSPEHPRHDEIVALHEEALERGEPFYVDPDTGLWVLTAASLWERECCERGCRHCPWVDR